MRIAKSPQQQAAQRASRQLVAGTAKLVQSAPAKFGLAPPPPLLIHRGRKPFALEDPLTAGIGAMSAATNPNRAVVHSPAHAPQDRDLLPARHIRRQTHLAARPAA